MATELARRGAKVIVNYANSIEAANKVVEVSGKRCHCVSRIKH